MLAPECGLVILPPPEVADLLRQAQSQASPVYVSDYPPHLTLKNLFVSADGVQPVTRAVARICASARPFSISLGRLTVFPSPQGNFIVRRVAQARPLMRLHRQLIEVLDPITVLADPAQDAHEEDGFVPHVTLLQRVPDSAVATVRSALASTQMHLTFRVDQIAMICQEPGGPWQQTQFFPLGSSGTMQPAKAGQARSPMGGNQP